MKLYDIKGTLFEGDTYQEDGKIFKHSDKIFPKEQLFTQAQLALIKFNDSTGVRFGGYNPVTYRPNPDDFDFLNKTITRYFVHKRNQPVVTLIEVDVQQYSTGGFEYGGTPETALWNGIEIEWMISGSEEEIMQHNKQVVQEASKTFRGLSTYLTNFLEFSEKDPIL